MQVIEAPNRTEHPPRETIFLAGGISNCYDWQSEMIDYLSDLNIVIYNPRRKDFDLSKSEESVIQIEWEFEYIRKASLVFFWFAPETLCPITLLELGSAAERWKQKRWLGIRHNLFLGNKTRVLDAKANLCDLFVGVHENYARKFDVKIQMGEYGFNNVVEGFEETKKRFREYLIAKNPKILTK